MKKILAPLAMLMLAACSAGETPRVVTPAATEPAYADFGNLRVRYNALPTVGLNEQAAKQYGVARDEKRALLVVSLRELRDGDEIPADGKVSAQAIDLQGERMAVPLKPVRTGEYVDHIGSFAISPRNHYRIEIAVEALGRRETASFRREF